jgi:hypothetical protein
VQVTLDWIHVAALVAAAQGFLLTGGLVAHRTNRTANRLLAALMAAFTVYLLADVYYSAGLMSRYPHLFGISYPLPWIFGPLVYLYAIAASDRSWVFKRRDALHFLPVLVVVLVALPTYLMSGTEKVALYERLRSGDVPAVIRILDPFKYVSGLAYSAMTFAHLRRHRSRVENSYSNTERVNLRWLLRLSGAAAGVWLLATVIGVLNAVPGPVRLRSDELVNACSGDARLRDRLHGAAPAGDLPVRRSGGEGSRRGTFFREADRERSATHGASRLSVCAVGPRSG